MARCACDQGFLAMGITSCYLVPQRIKKLIFTTELEPLREARFNNNLNNIFLALSGDNNSPSWYYEIATNPIPAAISTNFEFFLYYRDTYKLQTPILDDCVSEKADAVTEEVGGKAFFVRDGARSVTATLVAKPAEFIRFVEQLRCASELGVFFVDVDDVVWARRARWSFAPATRHIEPFPVLPATLSAKMELPTATTVQKITFNFTLEDYISDGDFVPVGSGDVYAQYNYASGLRYRSPVHLVGTARITPAGDLELRLYTEIHSAAGVITIPYNSATLGTYLPSVFDATGTVLTGPAAWTFVANGIYQQPLPANASYIAFAAAQLAAVPPVAFDAYSFLVRL